MKKRKEKLRNSRIVSRHEAIPGVGAMLDGTAIRIWHVFGHLIRDIEPVHVQQIV